MIAPIVLSILAASALVDDGGKPPSSSVYRTLGERTLRLGAHYPPGWKAGDRRPAMLLFSGSHKVMPDARGKLPPLAAERARLGLPVVNNGPPDRLVPQAEHFAGLGLVCFRVEYRTRGKDGVLPPDEVEDAVHAIRWVRGHAGELGVDPGRVVSAGSSSGAYLAASLFALDHLHPKGDRPEIPARPDALILLSPLVDWLEVGSMTDEFLTVLGGDKELGARVSPARHWRQDMPPTLILVGSDEPQVASVRALAGRWQGDESPMELFVAEGGPHGFFGRPEWRDRTFARTDAFLRALGYLDDPAGAGPTEPVYKTIGERTLKLAIHHPAGWKAGDRRAALICFGGGGENPKDKDGKPYPTPEERRRLGLPVVNEGPGAAFDEVAEHFAGRGMAAVRAEYRKRKTDGTSPAEAVADAADAIRWVRSHAAELGLDPNRLVACGASSGGHLAASLAALDGAEFEAAEGAPRVSRRPDALILHSPLMDFLIGGTKATPFLAALDNDRALGERLSPARHWSKDMPPTLLFTGEKEPVYDALCTFAETWRAAGQRIELVRGEGGHVSSLNAASQPATLARMEAFLEANGFLEDAGR